MSEQQRLLAGSLRSSGGGVDSPLRSSQIVHVTCGPNPLEDRHDTEMIHIANRNAAEKDRVITALLLRADARAAASDRAVRLRFEAGAHTARRRHSEVMQALRCPAAEAAVPAGAAAQRVSGRRSGSHRVHVEPLTVPTTYDAVALLAASPSLRRSFSSSSGGGGSSCRVVPS